MPSWQRLQRTDWRHIPCESVGWAWGRTERICGEHSQLQKTMVRPHRIFQEWRKQAKKNNTIVPHLGEKVESRAKDQMVNCSTSSVIQEGKPIMWPLLDRENVHCRHLQEPILPQQEERTSPQVPAQGQIPFDPAQNAGGGIGTSQTMGRGGVRIQRVGDPTISRFAEQLRDPEVNTYAGRKPDSGMPGEDDSLVPWIDKWRTRNWQSPDKSYNISCSAKWYWAYMPKIVFVGQMGWFVANTKTKQKKIRCADIQLLGNGQILKTGNALEQVCLNFKLTWYGF